MHSISILKPNGTDFYLSCATRYKAFGETFKPDAKIEHVFGRLASLHSHFRGKEGEYLNLEVKYG